MNRSGRRVLCPVGLAAVISDDLSAGVLVNEFRDDRALADTGVTRDEQGPLVAPEAPEVDFLK